MTTDNNINREDPLLRQARLLKEQTDRLAYNAKKTYDQSALGQTVKEVTGIARFFNQVAKGGAWCWENIGSPVYSHVVKPVTRGAFNTYRNIWDRAVYRTDEYGERDFSKKRAGMMVAATLAALCLLPGMAKVGFDAALYATTAQHNEVLYMVRSQELNPADNQHTALGNASLPLDDQESISFRISPSIFNHIWSVLNGRGLFYPDYVAGAVPSEVSRCTVTSYGIRLKTLMRNGDIYPELLAARCQPLRIGTDGSVMQPGNGIPMQITPGLVNHAPAPS